MPAISSLTNTPTSSGASKANSLEDLDINDFLKLMITELTNQDPLNPMDNTQLMEQIGQLRTISATSQLSDTLQAVTTGQSLATATSLIGKNIDALDDSGNRINGKVSSVTVQVDEQNAAKRSYRVHVGDKDVDLKNVRQVLP